MDSREADVTSSFVSLASGLATGRDAIDLLTDLTNSCARLLDVASAGLLLADGLGVLHLLAASSEATRELELLQIQRDEGPCLDCFRGGQPVSVPDLASVADRWPRFVSSAADLGFRSVHAVPLRLRSDVLGAMGLFGSRAGALNEQDLALGQALADVASVALVQDGLLSDRATVINQLQTALSSRVLIEQAKGVIAYAGGVDMGQAFAILRRYARDHNRRLSDVAQNIVDLKLPAQSLLNHHHARAKG